MRKNLSQSKLSAIYQLMRIDKPIGFFLLLWPSLWALWVATSGPPSFWILGTFLLGIFLMRSAGCVLNDYVDYKFDGYVKRTAYRPLPTGQISRKKARILFFVLVILSFFLVLTLNIMTIFLSVVGLVLTFIYPFMKRYTHLAQVVLGTAFGWPIPMAFSAVGRSLLSLSCWLIYFANILWVLIYDTQYAMVDRDDDLKIGIKSSAILFGRYDKLIIGILQVTFLILMVVIGRMNMLNQAFYFSLILAGILFMYQQKLIARREPNLCLEAFMNNNYVGLILYLGIAISYLNK